MLVLLSIILLVVFFLLLLAIILFFFQTFDLFLDLPYVATKKEKIATIMSLANIRQGETAIDLGSGDGRLLFAAARKGARAIGFEINPFLIFLTRLKALIMSLRGAKRRSNLKRDRFAEFIPSEVEGLAMTGSVIVKKQNLWQADLPQADVIFVYSLKTHIQKFEDFVYQNAKKGTRIIVNTNPFPTKKPLKEKDGIFLYTV